MKKIWYKDIKERWGKWCGEKENEGLGLKKRNDKRVEEWERDREVVYISERWIRKKREEEFGWEMIFFKGDMVILSWIVTHTFVTEILTECGFRY